MPNLDIFRKALSSLNNPHLHLPPVIHVAGTNGKGSVIAFIKTILETQGYKIHVFTSPHLLTIYERIVVAGEKITPALYHYLEKKYLSDLSFLSKITWFEKITLIAFLAFRQTKADFTLIETGIGGLYDATNVVCPILSIITSIGYDHQDKLGHTIQEIAFQKAGIIKKFTHVIIGKQYYNLRSLFYKIAFLNQSSLYQANYEWKAWGKDNSLKVKFLHHLFSYSLPSLKGSHQIDNAGLAIIACKLLTHQKNSSAHITKGLISTKWLGRLTKLSFYVSNQLYTIWLDGAHNAEAIRQITYFFYPQKYIIVFTLQKSKPLEAIGALLKKIAHFIYIYDFDHKDNFYPADHIENYIKSYHIPCCISANYPQILQTADRFSCPILFIGSLYLVGEAIKKFKEMGYLIEK